MAFDFFHLNLVHVRVSKGLTQSELAQRAGRPFTQALVSSYERGLRPSREHIDRLAAALGVPFEALVRPPRVVRQRDALQAVLVKDVGRERRRGDAGAPVSADPAADKEGGAL